ncbi:MAG: DUF932 domain-containing protein [Spirochaetes bacterium]|nr:DUF932 domain-containing protein [Spirochaetota bacterium]
MKIGRNLVELAEELNRQVNAKKDYLADTRNLAMSDSGDFLHMEHNGGLDLSVTNLCHSQIATRLGIPQKYYDRMRHEDSELLASNVNRWFQRKPERRMVRVLDNRARAFLSQRYRPLDNYDLAEAVLPKIREMECLIKSCELTETRMYLQVVTDRLTTEVKVGDAVQAGFIISNSEVGQGSLRVEPMIYRLRCLNGMISADNRLRKYHVGKASSDDGLFNMYKDETRQLDDLTFWHKVRDVVEATLTRDKFEEMVEKLRLSTEERIEGNPIKAVEEVGKRFLLNEDERGGVIRHLIEGADLSRYGVMNALTRMSQDIDDYDRAVEFERFGGEVIELPKSDWKVIASAN